MMHPTTLCPRMGQPVVSVFGREFHKMPQNGTSHLWSIVSDFGREFHQGQGASLPHGLHKIFAFRLLSTYHDSVQWRSIRNLLEQEARSNAGIIHQMIHQYKHHRATIYHTPEQFQIILWASSNDLLICTQIFSKTQQLMQRSKCIKNHTYNGRSG